jgi:hypothetical protein
VPNGPFFFAKATNQQISLGLLSFLGNRASQFSRYLLGTVGSLDRDKNARPGIINSLKTTRSAHF